MLLTAKAMKQLSDNNAYKQEKENLLKAILQDAVDKMIPRAKNGFTHLDYDPLINFDRDLFKNWSEVAVNVSGFVTDFDFIEKICEGLKKIGYEATIISRIDDPIAKGIPLIRITWKNA
jgi:hypothetical protein